MKNEAKTCYFGLYPKHWVRFYSQETPFSSVSNEKLAVGRNSLKPDFLGSDFFISTRMTQPIRRIPKTRPKVTFSPKFLVDNGLIFYNSKNGTCPVFGTFVIEFTVENSTSGLVQG